MNVTRRQFFKITAAGAGASGLAVMGMMPTQAFAEVRQYKLSRASEARNNCTSAHDRNTKLNLATAYQIKNEAID